MVFRDNDAGQRLILTADGHRHVWLHETITGTQLRELLGWGPEVPLLHEAEPEVWVELSDSDSIDLRQRPHAKIHKQWAYLFEGQMFCWGKRWILGSELRAQHQVPAGTPIVREGPDGREEDVADSDRIDLGKRCCFGVKASFRRGLCPRWELEINLLRHVHPDLRVDDRGWVEMHRFKLPEGVYNRDDDTVSFHIPPAYPQIGPDNFYVGAGLKFRDGRPLTNFSEGPGPFGGVLGIFSYHPERWRGASKPAEGDSLLSFVRAIKQRLGETT